MKGDFSQWRFDARENINALLHQQGRVLNDADLTEAGRIQLDWDDRTARDVIGADVAAVPAEDSAGFQITAAKVDGANVRLTVQTGRIWADGIHAFLSDPANPNAATVQRTASYFGPPVQFPAALANQIGNGTRDAVVLEVWREELSSFQNPSRWLEPALGGPDTVERVQTACAFRLVRLAAGEDCRSILPALHHGSTGKLSVTLEPVITVSGDCPTTAQGGYAGFEHNLYRIEIAENGTPQPTHFKWSQFNGGLVGLGTVNQAANPKTVKLSANHDAITKSGLTSFYLELVQFDGALGYWRPTYGGTVILKDGGVLELPAAAAFGSITVSNADTPVFFRLWNGLLPLAAFAPGPKSLNEDGILLAFDAPAAGLYRAGDFWTFSVRAGEIANDKTLIDKQPPAGPEYHRVPLAEINWTGRLDTDISGFIEDCRRRFRPLTNQNVCCTWLIGDGFSSFGDFNSLEEAALHLPPSGGKLCLLPGIHFANLTLQNRFDIAIHGCRNHTYLLPRPKGIGEPIIRLTDCQRIEISDISFIGLAGITLRFDGTQPGLLNDIVLSGNRVFGRVNALRVTGARELRVTRNRFFQWDVEDGLSLLSIEAVDSFINENILRLFPVGAPVPPDDKDDDGTPNDPCADLDDLITKPIYLVYMASWIWTNVFYFIPINPYRALGGLHLRAGCDNVVVRDNTIQGGGGNGITLGGQISKEDSQIEDIPSLVAGISANYKLGSLYDLVIETNEILEMGASGIGYGLLPFSAKAPIPPPAFPKLSTASNQSRQASYDKWWSDFANYAVKVLINPADLLATTSKVSELTIRNNRIHGNLLNRPFGIALQALQVNGRAAVALGVVESAVISGNTIHGNGADAIDPACGIYIGWGDNVEITGNSIAGNGTLQAVYDAPLEGIRGGIYVRFAAALNATSGRGNNGRPALRVQDNRVNQPAGRALTAFAFGPVSVVNNHFHSDVAGRHWLWDQAAGAVLILNFGGLHRVIERQAAPELRYYTNKNPAVAAKGESRSTEGKDFDNTASYYRTSAPSLPPGHTLASANQASTGPNHTAVTAQLIAAIEDVGFHASHSTAGNEARLFSNTLLAASTVRATDSRFSEETEDTLLSLLTLAERMNATMDNEGDHCIFATCSTGRIRNENLTLSNICDRFDTRSPGVYLAEFLAMASGQSVSQTPNDAAGYNLNFAEGIGATMTGIYTAQETAQQRDYSELARLVQTYPANHPRIAKVEMLVKKRFAVLGELGAQSDLASIKTYSPNEKEAAVQGRVLDAAGRAVLDAKVVLVIGTGAVANVAAVKPGAGGYFVFSLVPKDLDGLGSAGVTARALDSAGKTLGSSSPAVFPTPGSTVTANIVLPIPEQTAPLPVAKPEAQKPASVEKPPAAAAPGKQTAPAATSQKQAAVEKPAAAAAAAPVRQAAPAASEEKPSSSASLLKPAAAAASAARTTSKTEEGMALTLIKGISARIAKKLIDAGIPDLEHLAKANLNILTPILGTSAADIQNQAIDLVKENAKKKS